jgi:hypothetical protein
MFVMNNVKTAFPQTAVFVLLPLAVACPEWTFWKQLRHLQLSPCHERQNYEQARQKGARAHLHYR